MNKTEAMEKVIKLISLSQAEGPEGAAAHEKAKQLMLKHQIALADLEHYQAAKQQTRQATIAQDIGKDLLNSIWELFYPTNKLVDPANREIKKKLIWCAEGGLVKRWVAILADYVSESYDCVMWRDNGIWAAGSPAQLEKTQKTLEALVVKLNAEATAEALRRKEVVDQSHQVKWLQSWRLGRVEEIGQELLEARRASASAMDLLGFGERARVLTWVKENVELE